jgi:hypothetical protein
MRIAYDTEFLERGAGKPISLISIGMVREDGAELYYVNAAAPWAEIEAHPWLRDNVLPHLPRDEGHTEEWRPDYRRRDIVESPKNIANAVADFCYHSYGQLRESTELWADYGAYDHVVLAQLFGTMLDLPDHMPMYTNDLQQAARMLGSTLPPQTSSEHDALNDARWVMEALEYLQDGRVPFGVSL